MSNAQNQSTSEIDESVGTPEDLHDHNETSVGPSKPGRKKNPNTQAARRDQNRIAQREFRLRKQQKIRDLEARVELLSGDKDETYGQMREIMRNLMMENQQLRTLLKELGRFIGDGAGGQLSTSLGTIGWGLDQFNGFINRSETDTAFETFQALKRTKDPAAKTPDGGEGAGEGSDNRKRRRTTDSNPSSSNGIGGPFGLGGPVAASPTSGPSPSTTAAFASLMDSQVFGASTAGTNFPSRHNSINMSGDATTTVGGPSSSNTLPMASPSGLYPASFAPPPSSFLGQGPRSASGSNLPPMPPSNTTPKSSSAAREIASMFAGEWSGIDDPDVLKKNEADITLTITAVTPHIIYREVLTPHWSSARLLMVSEASRAAIKLWQTYFVLTLLEQIIDNIPLPELRDRMILLKDRYSLAEVVHTLFSNCTIHGDDVLAHENWEVHKTWLEKFPFLVDENTLAIANKWRRERGDPEITMAELIKE
ncbi:hypothetical protein FRC05_009264 [Tulasnella sp. 425]|nr:hypothetical protein FRC05_009264 [Tulasnella sp. 425]